MRTTGPRLPAITPGPDAPAQLNQRLRQVEKLVSATTANNTPGAAAANKLAQMAYASASLTLTTKPQDVPGVQLTLTQAGLYLIRGVFDFTCTGDTGQQLVGQLSVAPLNLAVYIAGTSGDRATVAQQWLYSLSSAPKVISLQAYKGGGAGTSIAGKGNTTLTALWVGA